MYCNLRHLINRGNNQSIHNQSISTGIHNSIISEERYVSLIFTGHNALDI